MLLRSLPFVVRSFAELGPSRETNRMLSSVRFRLNSNVRVKEKKIEQNLLRYNEELRDMVMLE